MASEDATGTPGERLQKFLARAGVSSRRKCEELILQGRVEVNGETVRRLGTRIFPEGDIVSVDGVAVKSQKPLYIVFNKPRNCLCTSRENPGPSRRHASVSAAGAPGIRTAGGRTTVFDFLPGISQRIYTVGRLDYDAEGLLILTNDGDFAQRVIHPRFRIPRTYRVAVRGFFTAEAADSLRQGVKLDGKLIQPLSLRIISRGRRTSRLQLELAQGINQQIKRMLGWVGYEVAAIKRIRIGKIELGSLPAGKFRRMTRSELSSFSQTQEGRR